MSPPRQVRKRDGRVVPFDRRKIADAIYKAAQAVGGEDRFLAEELAGVVLLHLERRTEAVPQIEDIQDLVERVLIDTGHAKTAKAYILYRERRAQARAARSAAEREVVPLVGGERGEEATAFSKAAVVDALVDGDGLPRPEAEEVARAVEARILRSGLARVSEDLLASLVRAEMFDRGRECVAGRVGVRGLAKGAVREALAEGLEGRLSSNPAAFAEGLGERLLEEHLLVEVLSPAVAEAHRAADLHLYDLGAPLRLTSVTLPGARLLTKHLWGEGFSRAAGPRRVAGALGRIVEAYGPYVARNLALEDVNVLLAPFLSHLSEDALAEEVRDLLLSPAFASFPGRGGFLALEFGIAAEVPQRLRAAEPPEPAPPGRPFGAYGDAALRVSRALLRESLALRRRGRAVGPVLTLVIPRGGPRDAAAKALVQEALSSAAEAGEPLLVFEDAARPGRGSRWLRLTEGETHDPLRFDAGDVTAATACALNLVAAALKAGKGGARAFLAETDRLVRLAIDAVAARRTLLEGRATEPGGSLYVVARGAHPLVDLESAVHLLEPVGADQAAALIDPEGERAERIAFRREVIAHVHALVQREGSARGLHLAVVEGLPGEAADRFARVDAQRFPAAAAWWGEAQTPSYRPPPGGDPGVRREPAWPGRLEGPPWFVRVRHRVDGDRRPAVEDLMRSMEAAEKDAAVVEYAVDPWPRRILGGATGGEPGRP